MPNKAISVATILEKSKVASGIPFLILLKIDIFNSTSQTFTETIYVANNNESVVFLGNTYSAFPFQMNVRYESGTIPEITLTAKDFQKVLLGKLEQYSGAIGSRVTMYVVNTANLTQGAEVSEVFEVINSSANDWSISIGLGAESVLTRLFPTRTQMRDRCAWRYKSAECGYTGALAACDLSLQGANGCAAHNNTVNFGGFPALVSRGSRYG